MRNTASPLAEPLVSRVVYCLAAHVTREPGSSRYSHNLVTQHPLLFKGLCTDLPDGFCLIVESRQGHRDRPTPQVTSELAVWIRLNIEGSKPYLKDTDLVLAKGSVQVIP
jgi:hypothetical protein